MNNRYKLHNKPKPSQQNKHSFFGKEVKQFFFDDVSRQPVTVNQAANGQILQTKPKPEKPGRVVRVEHVDRFRLVPPGPGAYSDAEYKDWQIRHPKAKFDYIRLVNRIRNEDPSFSFKELWLNGYYYARLINDGYVEVEVWLNDTGDGMERQIARRWI